MIKLLQRVSLSVTRGALLAVLVGACADSGSMTDQSPSSATASGGTQAAPTTASTPKTTAANGGSGTAAGSSAQRPTSSSTSQPSAAGSSSAATGGSSAGASTARASAGAGAAGISGAAGATAGASAGNAGMPASAGASGSPGAPAAGSSDCDRACLLSVMQKYLEAVVAHDPTKVPISPMVKMTDNGVAAKPGDGLWKTGTMLVDGARLDYADPTSKNVGTQCVINEGSSPAMYEVRLKVEAGQITEIETMTVRRQGAANGFFSPQNLKPEAVFSKKPEASEVMTRDQLQTTMQLYLDYLEGKKSGRDVPFDAMCKRYENGVATASGLSSFQAQSWSFQVTRRILIIDEEMQIVWGMFPFYQTDTTLVVGEAFKMLGGKFMMIQAIMANMPAKAWDK